MNYERLAKIVKHIKKHPETWDQQNWHCGTTHCVAGHAQINAGHVADRSTVRQDARRFLELSYVDAQYLFSCDRTLTDFERILCYRDGFGRDGFSRDGFGRAGFSRDGFSRDGFSRDGFDRDGFGRDGFDRDGFDINLAERT